MELDPAGNVALSYFVVYRANGRVAPAVFLPGTQNQGEEVRAPPVDKHLSSGPHGVLLVRLNPSSTHPHPHTHVHVFSHKAIHELS